MKSLSGTWFFSSSEILAWWSSERFALIVWLGDQIVRRPCQLDVHPYFIEWARLALSLQRESILEHAVFCAEHLCIFELDLFSAVGGDWEYARSYRLVIRVFQQTGVNHAADDFFILLARFIGFENFAFHGLSVDVQRKRAECGVVRQR